MSLYPLALLPQVTISQGKAQLPLTPGTDPEYASPDAVIAENVDRGVEDLVPSFGIGGHQFL